MVLRPISLQGRFKLQGKAAVISKQCLRIFHFTMAEAEKQVAVCHMRIGLDLKRTTEACQSLIRTTEIHKGAPQIIVRLSTIGFNRQHPLVVCDRLLKLSEIFQNVSEVAKHLNKIGSHFQRTATTRCGFV